MCFAEGFIICLMLQFWFARTVVGSFPSSLKPILWSQTVVCERAGIGIVEVLFPCCVVHMHVFCPTVILGKQAGHVLEALQKPVKLDRRGRENALVLQKAGTCFLLP